MLAMFYAALKLYYHAALNRHIRAFCLRRDWGGVIGFIINLGIVDKGADI